ncbi:MAG: DNA polymerase IV [Acidobacteriota bacterium]
MMRIVLHLDMDAFFAAVEQRERPELRGRPVLIGHPGARGVVATCSYEARVFGVRSAMPSVRAARLCPSAVWVTPRFDLYRDSSERIFSLVERSVPRLEQVSIDEAYGDLSGWCADFDAATALARALKQEISETERLTASIGVAPNRFLAKLASDLEKPNGLVAIQPHEAQSRIAGLSVRAIPGVGPKLQARLRLFDVKSIGEILRVREDWLIEEFGVETAAWLRQRARGEDDTPIGEEHERRQISEERTYERDLTAAKTIERELLARAEGVSAELRSRNLVARTVTLKARDADFRTVTRSITLEQPTDLTSEVHRAALQLWRERVDFGNRGVRLLGVGVKELLLASQAPRLLFADERRDKERAAERAADSLRERFGAAAVKPARLLKPPDRDHHR